MSNLPAGLGPDTRWTVVCDLCETEYHGRTEGDTGASYLEPGQDENDGPETIECVLCHRKANLCRECRERQIAPLCVNCDDGDEYETSDVAKILGVSQRMAQHIGRQMGKTIPPRMTGFLWTPEEIRTASQRNTKRGRRPASDLPKSAN